MVTTLQKITVLSILSAVALTTACRRTPAASGIEVETLKGRTLTLSTVETGIVTLDPDKYAKADQLDYNGRPVLRSAEIVSDFRKGDTLEAGSYRGFCVRFSVPAVEPDDYTLIEAQIRMPESTVIGGSGTDTLRSTFRYDVESSGLTEYIWFVFDPAQPGLRKKGVWSLGLFNNGTQLLSRSFTVQ